MTIDFEDQGFDFTRDLCSAIEKYTASESTKKPGAFSYRGMDLRFAVERWLYINGINSAALFQRYMTLKNPERKQAATAPLSETEAAVAAFFPGAKTEEKRPLAVIRPTLHRAVRMGYFWLHGLWQKRRQPPAAPSRLRPGILIHIVNTKFARYLAPVTERFDESAYSYLSIFDTNLAEQLRSRGLPVIDGSGLGPALRPIFLQGPLRMFGPLVREAELTISAIKELQPDSVLVVEGNAPLDVITSEACRLLGIPCYCIQQGWSPYVHSGFRNMTYTEMFVWGRRFADLLRPYNPDQTFRVTGSHVMQRASSPARGGKSAIRTLSFFLQSPCALLSVDAFAMFANMITDIARSYPGVELIVREHPGYPLQSDLRKKFGTCPNIRLSDPAAESLAKVILASDMVVSIFSTVLLEAVAMDVVPLICSIGAMPRYEPDLVSARAAIEVRSVAEARQVIDEAIADPARLVPIRQGISEVAAEFFDPSDAVSEIATRLLSARRLPAEDA